MVIRGIHFCFLIVFFIFAGSAGSEELTVYTEEFAPFNFTQNQKVTGASTEIVQRVLAAAGLKARFVVLPWEQTFSRAQQEENALIYSISRTERRENLFKWIDLLAPAVYSVLALKSRSDIQVETLLDLKNYKIGTSVSDARETYLLSKGFVLTDFVRTEGSNAAVKGYKNLLNGHIDCWPMPEAVAFHLVKQQGNSNPEGLLQRVFDLEELSGGYYLAASPKTPDAVVNRIAYALKQFKQTDDYFKILSHWNINVRGLKNTEPIDKLLYSLKFFKRSTKIGYLAGDKLAAHQQGGMLRKEIKEQFIEHYVRSFDEWRDGFVKLQKEVDILIIGPNSEISGWNHDAALGLVHDWTSIPTGCLIETLFDYVLVGYHQGGLVVNMPVARKLGLKIPSSFLSKASRIIE